MTIDKFARRRATVGLVVGLGLASMAHATASGDSAKYRKVGGNPNMPSHVIFRHCNGQEDELGHLVLVDFDPANDRMVYRCKSRGF